MTLSEFARQANGPSLESTRLELGLSLVVELVDGCDQAGVMTMTRQGPQTTTATSDLVYRSDRLQYELEEGPALDSFRLLSTVMSGAIGRDRRWPRWGPAVAGRYGVGSVLSVVLSGRGAPFGVLNLYGVRGDAFNDSEILVAESLAGLLAVVLAEGRDIDNLERAVASRTAIGQAEGILMERHKLSAEEAFDVLRRASQSRNVKLVTVAEELITTGQLNARPTRQQLRGL
ncbi:MAG: GAF and ANTAR domain-containing protein [Actinobacteria bacterium]|nr:GAF and ANTAR domain-containing protein [Actinomycetota bacterium]